MRPPLGPPIGLQLSRAARLLSRAFDDALAEVGGSLPVWLVLMTLKTGRAASQRELAEAIGITEGTLTHHLNAMDDAGLVTRRRDRANRRIHVIELTAAGEAAFVRLRDTAVAFDSRMRTYRLPVSYVPDGDSLLTPGGGNWKLNLADGQPIRIRLRGQDRYAVPEIIAPQPTSSRCLRR